MTTPVPSASVSAIAPRSLSTGIAYGMGAGALWGLVFLAPELVREFSPLQLTVGRYLCYGMIAVALIAPRWRALTARIERAQWRELMWLALAGNTLYYVLLSTAVQRGGIAMTSLVIGLLPVTVTIVGSRERGAVPLTRLWPSLLLSVAGTLCIGWQALTAPAAAPAAERLFGLLCALAALASWTVFAVRNACCLQRMTQVSAHDWSLLTGVATGAQALVLLPIAFAVEPTTQSAEAWLTRRAEPRDVASLRPLRLHSTSRFRAVSGGRRRLRAIRRVR